MKTMEKKERDRKTGIDIVGHAPWGTHLCLFYKDKQDLIDVLVPYFKAGLQNNEFCMWVTSKPLNAQEANSALRQAVQNLDAYINRGQIEILDYTQWYTESGKFEADKVLQGWVTKHDQALKRGFDGLRLSGNTFWLEKDVWREFINYEATVNDVIGKYRMLAVCTYSLERCGASEVIDVVSTHQFALIRREDEWQIIESTKHKNAEEALQASESKYRTLLESLPQKIFLKDRNSVYLSCNDNYARDLKIEAEQIAGRTDYEFYPKELAEKYRADDQRIMQSGQVENIEEKYLLHGQEVSVQTVKTSVKDEHGNVTGVLGIFWDITERKKAEQCQAELLKKVESANKELTDFAYVVSHDLKAPLRGIKTLAQWITTDYADKIDENGRGQLNLLLSRADRMHNLIDGILQYSRVGRVKENKVQVNLNELVAEAIYMIAPPENISITVKNELPVIECERTRIAQVFQNLLSNAVKFMDKPQGHIRVGCVEEDGFWKFTVADNGPGIEEKYFEKIFQMFQTLAPRDDVESTGVGLTVAKKIVELYGGKIWVESKVGEGSTFLFTLSKQETEVKDAQLQASIVG
jgi:PAS domain S-box-containing protein